MSDSEVDESAAPLIEHLAELRNRLIRSAMAFIVAMIACFTVAAPMFEFLARPVCDAMARHDRECELIYTGAQQGFVTYVRISLFGGFILAFPYIGAQMWKFVAPGLYSKEKQAFLPFLIASPVMFTLGAVFAYYVVLPLAFDFFLGFQKATDGESGVGIAYLGTINEYLGLTIKFILAFGLCFQLPVLMTLMGKADLISSEGMGRTRKYAMIGILVLAAVVTPPDVITQVILFTVVYGLYEISILLVRRVERQREARLRAEGYYDDDPAPEGAEAEQTPEKPGDTA